MSQLLQVATRATGQFQISALNPDRFDQGIPYVGAALAYEQSAPVDHVWQGLPLTPAGRLAAVLAGTPTRYNSGGMPLTAAGQLCFGTGDVDRVVAGIPYTALGQLKV